MTDDAALLQTIIEHPDDDAPRLIYADWLEDHGDTERAEFIRVQIELARLSEDDPRRPEVDRRERALRKAHFEEWINPLRALAPFYKTRSEYLRGFVDYISVADASHFFHVADNLFSLSPIRRMNIDIYDNSELGRLGLAVWLVRLSHLRLVTWQTEDEALAKFASSRSLPQHIELHVSGSMGTKAAAALSRPDVQSRFTTINLHACLMPVVAEEGLSACFRGRVQLPTAQERQHLEMRHRLTQQVTKLTE